MHNRDSENHVTSVNFKFKKASEVDRILRGKCIRGTTDSSCGIPRYTPAVAICSYCCAFRTDKTKGAIYYLDKPLHSFRVSGYCTALTAAHD